ncbi:NusG domain II-containing protein [Evansella cellulosilytica]|uniref:Uncharacterized protein n=1 Tax=Evansella cellulosilytica (strain ATCC 21833 / DSM 2522 / FERM P-1141 / JCM 9156 / N-4) TaxID=649639 RepID=E6U1E0_EVAC2|nr:NusG domain II-containing protein [Evansella cellulosilytica]ADU29187.1 protein of unknown function DUF1312 [Evansella cellulosilytica DSM 2522]
MKLLRLFKRWDWVIIVTLLLLSFLPSAVFSYQQAGISEDAELVAIISVDNEVVEEITLTGHVGNDILDIPGVPCDTESIELKDGQIRMKSSHCPEQICVLTGFISRPGQTIICLHHRVIIEIQAVQGHTDEIIISY